MQYVSLEIKLTLQEVPNHGKLEEASTAYHGL